MSTSPPSKANSNSSTVLEWNSHGEFLSNAMSNFFRSGYQVDTSVTFRGERLIGVHRLLMAAFLPTFKRAVDGSDVGPLAELNFDCIASSIEDVTALLEFVYTGRAIVSDHRIDELSRLAKDLCFEGLSDAIALHHHHQQHTITTSTNVDNEPIVELVTFKEELYDADQEEEEDDDAGRIEDDANMSEPEQLDDQEQELQDQDENCKQTQSNIVIKTEEIDYQEDQLGMPDENSNMTPDQPDSDQQIIVNPADMCSIVVDATTGATTTTTSTPVDNEKAVTSNAGHNSCSSGALRCELCDMQFNSNWDLKIHFRCTHPTDKLYECRKCNFNAISDLRLYRHAAAVHKHMSAATAAVIVNNCRKIQPGPVTKKKSDSSCDGVGAAASAFPASGLFPCDRCGKEFTLPSSLLRHVADEHDVLNHYHCLKCPRSFASRYWLASHMSMKHPEHKTSTANKGHSTSRSANHASKNQSSAVANRSMDLVNENFPHEGKLRCALCNMKFDSKMDLKIHFRCSHPTIKLYECKKCEFVTVIERRMERHRRGATHSGNGNAAAAAMSGSSGERFPCIQCGKEYSMTSSLQRHMTRVHSGPLKRLKCRDCSQSFATRYNLARHISYKHSDRNQEVQDQEVEEDEDDPSILSDPENELIVPADSEESSETIARNGRE